MTARKPRTWRMACSLTKSSVRDRTKTVTRRAVNTWQKLEVGDELVLVDQVMGVKKGQHQNELARAVVVDVRVEPLSAITVEEIVLEGVLGQWTPESWANWWKATHSYPRDADPYVRRIEWEYLP